MDGSAMQIAAGVLTIGTTVEDGGARRASASSRYATAIRVYCNYCDALWF